MVKPLQTDIKHFGKAHDLFHAYWETAPADGTEGTYAGVAGKGALVTATDTGRLYRNEGTLDSPVWVSYDKQLVEQKYPFAFNMKNSLANWSSKYRNNNGILNINIVGDSFSEGGIASPSYGDNGYAGVMRSLLNAISDVGKGFVPVYFPYDTPLMTFSGTWADSGFGFGMYGTSKMSSVANDYAQFTISGTGVEIYYVKGSSAGTFKVLVDSVEVATVNANSGTTNAIARYDVTGLTDGAHTIKLVVVGSTIFTGYREIKGTRGVKVNMCCKWGTKAADAVSTYSTPLIELFKPDLTVICFIANDSSSQTALATYAASMQSLITSAKKTGDVILVSCGLGGTPSSPLSEAEYSSVCRMLALTNNCGFIDLNSMVGSFVAAVAGGYIDNSNGHPKTAMHTFLGNTIIDLIK